MVKQLATFIWDVSELTGIGLGKLSPWIFGLMIGSKGKRIKWPII